MKNRHGICGYQAQRAFYLPLRRSRFGDQMVRAFESISRRAFAFHRPVPQLTQDSGQL
jgi:hypothetical protein